MDFLNQLFTYANGIEISGLTEELCNIYLSNLFNKEKRNIVVVTSSLYEANHFYND